MTWCSGFLGFVIFGLLLVGPRVVLVLRGSFFCVDSFCLYIGFFYLIFLFFLLHAVWFLKCCSGTVFN